MYEVVVSVVGLALLVAVLLFDCRVRVEAARPGTWHFSDRLLQSAGGAALCVSLVNPALWRGRAVPARAWYSAPCSAHWRALTNPASRAHPRAGQPYRTRRNAAAYAGERAADRKPYRPLKAFCGTPPRSSERPFAVLGIVTVAPGNPRCR